MEVENGTHLTEGDESNATANLIRQVLGAVAEFEKTALVGKLRAARARERRETGRCEGPRPSTVCRDRMTCSRNVTWRVSSPMAQDPRIAF